MRECVCGDFGISHSPPKDDPEWFKGNKQVDPRNKYNLLNCCMCDCKLYQEIDK